MSCPDAITAVWSRASQLADAIGSGGMLSLRPDLLREVHTFLTEWRCTEFVAPVLEALARRGLNPTLVEIVASATEGMEP